MYLRVIGHFLIILLSTGLAKYDKDIIGKLMKLMRKDSVFDMLGGSPNIISYALFSNKVARTKTDSNKPCCIPFLNLLASLNRV